MKPSPDAASAREDDNLNGKNVPPGARQERLTPNPSLLRRLEESRIYHGCPSLDPVNIRRVQLLDAVVRAGSTRQPFRCGELSGSPGRDTNTSTVREDVLAMHAREWVNAYLTDEGDLSITALPEGISTSTAFRTVQSLSAPRLRACRESLLVWIALRILCDGETDSAVDEFGQNPAQTFYGSPFSQDETAAATRWLQSAGHLKAADPFSGAFRLTAEGYAWIQAWAAARQSD